MKGTIGAHVATLAKEKRIKMENESIIGWNMSKNEIVFVCIDDDHYLQLMIRHPTALDIDRDLSNPLSGIVIVRYKEIDKDVKPLKDTDYSHLKASS